MCNNIILLLLLCDANVARRQFRRRRRRSRPARRPTTVIYYLFKTGPVTVPPTPPTERVSCVCALHRVSRRAAAHVMYDTVPMTGRRSRLQWPAVYTTAANIILRPK